MTLPLRQSNRVQKRIGKKRQLFSLLRWELQPCFSTKTHFEYIPPTFQGFFCFFFVVVVVCLTQHKLEIYGKSINDQMTLDSGIDIFTQCFYLV